MAIANARTDFPMKPDRVPMLLLQPPSQKETSSNRSTDHENWLQVPGWNASDTSETQIPKHFRTKQKMCFSRGGPVFACGTHNSEQQLAIANLFEGYLKMAVITVGRLPFRMRMKTKFKEFSVNFRISESLEEKNIVVLVLSSLLAGKDLLYLVLPYCFPYQI